MSSNHNWKRLQSKLSPQPTDYYNPLNIVLAFPVAPRAPLFTFQYRNSCLESTKARIIDSNCFLLHGVVEYLSAIPWSWLAYEPCPAYVQDYDGTTLTVDYEHLYTEGNYTRSPVHAVVVLVCACQQSWQKAQLLNYLVNALLILPWIC